MQRTKRLYGVSNTMSWSHTTRTISMSRRSTKMSSHRFCSSKKDFARKEEKGMDIDTWQGRSTIVEARLIHSAIKAPDVSRSRCIIMRMNRATGRLIGIELKRKAKAGSRAYGARTKHIR